MVKIIIIRCCPFLYSVVFFSLLFASFHEVSSGPPIPFLCFNICKVAKTCNATLIANGILHNKMSYFFSCKLNEGICNCRVICTNIIFNVVIVGIQRSKNHYDSFEFNVPLKPRFKICILNSGMSLCI